MSLLPSLWTQAGDKCLLKQLTLVTLTALLTAMKDESRKFHSMIIPLIRSSIDPKSETRLYRLDDALELWAFIELLAQTTESSADITGLIDHLFSLFEIATENLRTALDITQSYCFLAPQAMLEASGRLFTSFASLISGRIKREVNGLVTEIVQTLIQAANAVL